MTITDFHKAVMVALDAEPDEDILKELAEEAHNLADMVGWADDTIDKDDRVSDAFLDLQTRAKTRYDASKNESVAVIHDAIGDLMVAIIKHDRDLDPSTEVNDDSGVA